MPYKKWFRLVIKQEIVFILTFKSDCCQGLGEKAFIIRSPIKEKYQLQIKIITAWINFI